MIEELSKQPTLALRMRCSPPDLSGRVPEAIRDVRAAGEAEGVVWAGPPYTRYLGHHPAEGVFDVEVGVPVTEPMVVEGEVAASELPSGPAVLLWHQGPYASIGGSFVRLGERVAELGCVEAGAPWESYVVGPESESDATLWRTALYQPVLP